MSFEIRNEYGFPVLFEREPESLSKMLLGFDLLAPAPAVVQPVQQESDLDKARRYAAEAKARNTPRECEACKHDEKLQRVIQIVNNWSSK